MAERVFVGNLSYQCTESELRSAFEENGFQVAEVAIVMDRETGQSRGFGFVTMTEVGDAKKAMSLMEGTVIARRPIRVSEAHERERRPGGGGRPSAPAAVPQQERRGGGGRRGRDRDEDRY